MKEITVTFYNGCIESVENVPKGQTVITRDIDDDGTYDQELLVRRWSPGDVSELIYEGTIEGEKWEDKS